MSVPTAETAPAPADTSVASAQATYRLTGLD